MIKFYTKDTLGNYWYSLRFGTQLSQENIKSKFKYIAFAKAIFFQVIGKKITFYIRWYW